MRRSWVLEVGGVLTAAFAVYTANPIAALLSLIAAFASVIVVLVLQHAEFLGYLFLIIYIGAIAILFLFVIMMFNLRETTSRAGNAETTLFGLVVLTAGAKSSFTAHALVGQTVVVSYSATAMQEFVQHIFTDILSFSVLLYTKHSCLFILIGLLLLTAMLGAIVLAMSTTGPVQHISAVSVVGPVASQRAASGLALFATEWPASLLFLSLLAVIGFFYRNKTHLKNFLYWVVYCFNVLFFLLSLAALATLTTWLLPAPPFAAEVCEFGFTDWIPKTVKNIATTIQSWWNPAEEANTARNRAAAIGVSAAAGGLAVGFWLKVRRVLKQPSAGSTSAQPKPPTPPSEATSSNSLNAPVPTATEPASAIQPPAAPSAAVSSTSCNVRSQPRSVSSTKTPQPSARSSEATSSNSHNVSIHSKSTSCGSAIQPPAVGPQPVEETEVLPTSYREATQARDKIGDDCEKAFYKAIDLRNTAEKTRSDEDDDAATAAENEAALLRRRYIKHENNVADLERGPRPRGAGGSAGHDLTDLFVAGTLSALLIVFFTAVVPQTAAGQAAHARVQAFVAPLSQRCLAWVRAYGLFCGAVVTLLLAIIIYYGCILTVLYLVTRFAFSALVWGLLGRLAARLSLSLTGKWLCLALVLRVTFTMAFVFYGWPAALAACG